jgi:malonyl-CoA O-methyltransferase
MNIQAAYTDWSATYDEDRNRTRDLDQEVTEALLGGSHYASAAEIGCGTGKNTLLLARAADKVTALDFSAGMLARARAKVQSPNVTFVEADLTQPWPLEDGSAELVVCNLVLEHIAGLPFVFAEAARVLRKGGRFFVCELHPFRQYQGTQAVFQREAGAILIDAYVHHVSDFLGAAEAAGLRLENLKEWWHAEDEGKPPRLVSFLFSGP